MSLLESEHIRRWRDNLARGSHITAEVYVRRLRLFCDQNRITPQELVQLGKRDRGKLEDLIFDHVTKMEREGKAGGYIKGVLKSIRSWLVYNDVELKRRIRVKDANATPTIEDERVPDKEELRAIFNYASDRAKVSIALMSQAGLRPETLGNGEDGLRIKDLPELKIADGKISFLQIPTMIIVRSSLSKARHRYFTFLPSEGCEYLKAYLQKRIASGEDLTPESPIISFMPGREAMGFNLRVQTRQKGFISTKSITKEIREAIRKGFTWRPYVLRAYFDTQLMLAESHGKISHTYRQFFMGHKGDLEARYTTEKGRLPPHIIEDMRSRFRICEEYLTTTVRQERDKKEMLLEMWRQQAKMYGIDPMRVRIEMKKELNREPSIEEELEAMQKQILKASSPHLLSKTDSWTNDHGRIHKIVAEEELVTYLDEGWEIVKEFNSGKILVRKGH